jgi:hypothetical protein
MENLYIILFSVAFILFGFLVFIAGGKPSFKIALIPVSYTLIYFISIFFFPLFKILAIALSPIFLFFWSLGYFLIAVPISKKNPNGFWTSIVLCHAIFYIDKIFAITDFDPTTDIRWAVSGIIYFIIFVSICVICNNHIALPDKFPRSKTPEELKNEDEEYRERVYQEELAKLNNPDIPRRSRHVFRTIMIIFVTLLLLCALLLAIIYSAQG